MTSVPYFRVFRGCHTHLPPMRLTHSGEIDRRENLEFTPLLRAKTPEYVRSVSPEEVELSSPEA